VISATDKNAGGNSPTGCGSNSQYYVIWSINNRAFPAPGGGRPIQGGGSGGRERHDAVIAEPVDSDHAVLRLHFEGDVVEPVGFFAELLGDMVYGTYVRDFVDVHGQAASAAIRALPAPSSPINRESLLALDKR
jgi:hypothetical protein